MTSLTLPAPTQLNVSLHQPAPRRQCREW